MINIIQRAIDVQMYVMGSSVYEERSWQKKVKPKSTVPPPLPQPSSNEPSVILTCPYQHHMKSTHSGESSSSSHATTTTTTTTTTAHVASTQSEPKSEPIVSSSESSKSPFNTKELISKCPYSFDLEKANDGDEDRESLGSCPFGSIQQEVPGVTEDLYQLIANRLQSLPDHIFEKQFIQQRCVFTSYDGTMLPW